MDGGGRGISVGPRRVHWHRKVCVGGVWDACLLWLRGGGGVRWGEKGERKGIHYLPCQASSSLLPRFFHRILWIETFFCIYTHFLNLQFPFFILSFILRFHVETGRRKQGICLSGIRFFLQVFGRKTFPTGLKKSQLS